MEWLRRKGLFLTILTLLCAALRLQAAKPDIYDTQADGKVLIAAALKKARAENKHVLLQFGANWCPPCHSLHDLFESAKPIREKLAASFVVVLIDTNGDHNADVNLRYGSPTLRGLPVLVILDSAGNQIFTQETGIFEKGSGHDPVKVLDFLNKWP